MASRRILLLSSDLMATSRLSGVVRGLGDSIDVRVPNAAATTGVAYDVALIDVQGCPDPGATIAAIRALQPSPLVVITYGPHVWRERLAAAVTAGADAAASRGEVMEGLAALLDRVAPQP